MKKILFSILLFPAVLFGQGTTGIRFGQNSVTETRAKAKQGNKYIFLACYSSACGGPCQQMDRVYADSAAAAFINANFLAVKIQVDSTGNDDEHTTHNYADALAIRNQYGISSVPALLFFSPDGNFVGQGSGVLSAPDFINLAKQALALETLLYYRLTTAFLAGNKVYAVMPYLAMTAEKYHDDQLAQQMARDYKENYLDKADEKVNSSKENLDFIFAFPQLIFSGDKVFNLLYHQPATVDSLYHNPNLSGLYVRWIIQKEIGGKLFNSDGTAFSQNPDWKAIYQFVSDKYSINYAREMVGLPAKISFYRKTKQWQLWADSIDTMLKRYPAKPLGREFASKAGLAGIDPNDDWTLNSIAWDVFQHCDDKQILKIALKWSDLSLTLVDVTDGIRGEYLDTKANLLYKLGKKKGAIIIEQKIVEDEQASSKKSNQVYDASKSMFYPTVAKMKAGEKTW